MKMVPPLLKKHIKKDRKVMTLTKKKSLNFVTVAVCPSHQQ